MDLLKIPYVYQEQASKQTSEERLNKYNML